MPLVELKLREGRLDDAAIEELTTELTRAASQAEGPTYLVRVSLAAGLADDDGKATLVELVDDAIAAVDPDYNPMATWVVVDEVADGHWGAGGSITSSAEIASVCGTELVDE